MEHIVKEKRRPHIKDPLYRELSAIAIPIVIQNLLSTFVSSADVIMLNFVGQESLAAVSLAANYTNILFMVYYGLSTGATILAAQYFGKKDYQAIEAVEGIALRFSILFSLLFSGFCFLAPRLMMKLYTPDEALISIGASYLRWIGVSYLFMSVAEVHIAILRAAGHVKMSTVLSTIGFTLNIILNAVFIFVFKMGAVGVGIATAISRGVEFLGCVIVSVRSENLKIRILRILKLDPVLFKDFLKLSLPALLNDISWSVAFSMYSVIMGHMNSDIVAANSIVSVVRNFGSVFGFAVASASGILVGNILGTGDLVKAKEGADKSIKAAALFSVLGGILVAIAMPFILMAEKNGISVTAYGYLKWMLLINIVYISGGVINTTLIAGIFRSGGDTKFGLVCDTIDMWCYAVPLGFIAAFLLKLPPIIVYLLLCTDEFVKWPWVFKRYREEKWLKNITRDDLFET